MRVRWVIPVLLLAAPAALAAGVCMVPGTHSTIQQAVEDTSCATVRLGAGTFAESVQVDRPLTLEGAGPPTVVAGFLRAVGSAADVTVADLRVENGCPLQALSASRGARLVGVAVEVVASSALPCPAMTLFADGFETGDSSAWSITIP